jgi:CheY-like chemotaxis protein
MMLVDTSFTSGGKLDHNPSAFTILIVDNDLESTNYLVQTLLHPRGYKTIVARTGRKALDHIRRMNVDLLLLSWQLPDMTGDELLETLVKSGRRSPSIIMSYPGSEHIAVRAFRLGARGYLNRPLDAEETIQTIRQVLTERWGMRRDARLIENMRRRLQRFVVLVQVAYPIISLRRSDELFTQIVDAAVLVTGAEEGFLLLVDPETQGLELRAMRLSDQEKTQLGRYPVGETPAKQVIQTRKPMRMGEEELAQFGTGYLVKGAIHVPLETPGRILGVLSVDRKDLSEPFTSEDEEILVQFAGCAAVALENFQLFHQMELARQALASQMGLAQENLSLLRDSLPGQDETREKLIDQLEQVIGQANGLLGVKKHL